MLPSAAGGKWEWLWVASCYRQDHWMEVCSTYHPLFVSTWPSTFIFSRGVWGFGYIYFWGDRALQAEKVLSLMASIVERTWVLILRLPKCKSFHVAWSSHSKTSVHRKTKLFLLVLLFFLLWSSVSKPQFQPLLRGRVMLAWKCSPGCRRAIKHTFMQL